MIELHPNPTHIQQNMECYRILFVDETTWKQGCVQMIELHSRLGQKSIELRNASGMYWSNWKQALIPITEFNPNLNLEQSDYED
jgi:hypothetical protein